MMDLETITDRFNSIKHAHNIDFEPKLEQMQIATELHNGHDTLGFLPTGFGKTLCFVVNEIIGERRGLTLIISPLLSLMDDQMKALTHWNLSCAKIAHDTPSDIREGIVQGSYSFVFASPESVLKPFWRKTFLSKAWQENITLLVFDEAHCLSEWGEDFRPEYKEMAQLRSFFKAPTLAVTATCTQKIKDDIFSILQLSPITSKIVSKSPDRPNIFILCQKRAATEIEIELSWLVSHLRNKGKNSKKIIIYCRSIDKVSEIFLSLKSSLGENAYADSNVDSDHLLIEMYHKCTHDTSKERILNAFCKTNSNIRCVIATVALGMGVDIPDVDIVIHYGCPKSPVSYWQEAGRCARDGRQGLSFILYDNFTAALKSTDKEMASIVKTATTKCARQMVMDVFTLKDNRTNSVCEGCQDCPCKCQACSCCSYCASKCQCLSKMTLDIFLA